MPDLTRPKSKDRVVSEKYCEAIRGGLCIVCIHLGVRQKYRTEAAHSESRGHADGSDLGTLSLCATHHKDQHGTKSMRVFLTKFGLDVDACIATAQEKYCMDRCMYIAPGETFKAKMLQWGLAFHESDLPATRKAPGSKRCAPEPKSAKRKKSKLGPLTVTCNKF